MEEDSGFFSNEELETLMLFFLDQASMLLDNANQCLLKLETHTNDEDALNQLQRTLHTLKGDANSVGFGEIGTISHKLEDLVALWGKISSDLNIEVLDLLLFGIDALGDMLQRKRQWVHAPLEIDSIIDRIDKFINKHSTHKKIEVKQVELIYELNEYQKLKIQKALELGLTKLWQLEAYFDVDCVMHGAGLLILLRELNYVSEVIATFPDVEDDQIEEVEKVIIILLSDETESVEEKALIAGVISSISVVAAVLANNNISLNSQNSQNTQNTQNTQNLQELKEEENEASYPQNLIEQPFEQKGKTTRLDRVLDRTNNDETNFISHTGQLNQTQELKDVSNPQVSRTNSGIELLRVSAEKVDLLMDLVGELIINRSMLNQVSTKLKGEFPKNPRVSRLMDIDSYLGRLLSQLQKAVLEVRMISLDQTFNRFFRVVRDLAKERSKQIELTIVGEETELDKRVVDIIYEPLLHLVRNAADHGIESVEDRIKLGKTPQGKITLKAYHQADQVVIEITDDGKGIDIEKLKKKALEKFFRTETELRLLKDQDAYDLMFLSGISTADQVTEVSGRGVGMGVVKTVIANLKGTIEVNSQVGQGTSFVLRLPLTLAIIRTMLFSIDDRVFAIPLTSMVEIVRLKVEDVKQIGSHKVFSREDALYSLVNLRELLLSKKQEEEEEGFVLIVGLGDRRIGLIVEKVIGESEIVVKAVDKQWITSDLIAGASILGDGRIVLIIDVGALFGRTTLTASAK